jgi:hypothetical protein
MKIVTYKTLQNWVCTRKLLPGTVFHICFCYFAGSKAFQLLGSVMLLKLCVE